MQLASMRATMSLLSGHLLMMNQSPPLIPPENVPQDWQNIAEMFVALPVQVANLRSHQYGY